MDPRLIPLTVKQNAKQTQDAFADMMSWTSSIKDKDQGLKKKNEKENKAVSDIRSKRNRKKHVVKVNSDGSEVEDSENEEEEELERMKLAEEYKTEGNNNFKNKKYKEAVDAYTMAGSLDVGNAVYPANRAMANMKLGNHAEAENDCTRALKQDPTYEKALFRRGQCRNILGKLEGAKIDFLAVLKVNSSSVGAKKELADIEKRLHQSVKWTYERPEKTSKLPFKMINITETNAPTKLVQIEKTHEEIKKNIEPVKIFESSHIEKSKIMKDTIIIEKTQTMKPIIEEINKENKDEPKEIQMITEIIDESSENDEELSPSFKKPKNAFELERDWRSLTSYKAKGTYLRLSETRTLAHLFAPQLPKYLVEICSTLAATFNENKSYEGKFTFDLLTEISRVARFKTAVFFLLENEKEIIRTLINELKRHNFTTTEIERAYLH